MLDGVGGVSIDIDAPHTAKNGLEGLQDLGVRLLIHNGHLEVLISLSDVERGVVRVPAARTVGPAVGVHPLERPVVWTQEVRYGLGSPVGSLLRETVAVPREDVVLEPGDLEHRLRR